MGQSQVRRIGIVGFGELGQFLSKNLLENERFIQNFALAFVWNRSKEALKGYVPDHLQLESLDNFESFDPDLVVEVAHPLISEHYGERFLTFCDYMAGSPTAFANPKLYDRLIVNSPSQNGLYIPRGALPGLEEIVRMRLSNSLSEAQITMKKHPSSIHFQGELTIPLAETRGQRILFEGPLRQLCSLAPNNVNTMAVLALSSGLGFDKVSTTLVADPELEHHVTVVELFGPKTNGAGYKLTLIRESPASVGAVTSTATLTTFLESMIAAKGFGSGIHFV